ncbi:Rrf2 family transcriptional regulator [Desulfitobacterium sp. Sab5]|uniref:Rrf2 family transcriptional regulator n=1 Tax=Desulfitobacterium nosdiversum TaxID=3375356 RepID=UPI003CF101F0
MINSRLAVAIHILSLINTFKEEHATSEWIATSVNTNPVVIRRISSQLKKAGIIENQVGGSGSALVKSPSEITLLDVYRAVQTEKDLFSIHEAPNPKCPVGKNIQAALQDVFQDVQNAMEKELAHKTLADILNQLSI